MPILSLEATLFNKEQLEQRLSLPQLPQVAMAGRSNVGKSSLVNALGGRKQLAKISATPGKTRSLNYYKVEPEDIWIVDLPGYGYARCSKEERRSWGILIERYLTSSPELKALVLLLDCRLPPQKADQDLAMFARLQNIPIIPVLTKIDQCKQREQSARQKEWSILLDGILPLLVSSKHNKGIEALWKAIFELV